MTVAWHESTCFCFFCENAATQLAKDNKPETYDRDAVHSVEQHE